MTVDNTLVSQPGAEPDPLLPEAEDAAIPEPQARRLEHLGAWLAGNGEAIFGTRPWDRAGGETTDGTAFRFTRGADALYLILLDTPVATEIEIRPIDADPHTTVTCLVAGTALRTDVTPGVLRITFERPLMPAAQHRDARPGARA